ncbi:MAG: hypothetical protein AVDCRST_MAG26-1734 [uncultured Chloroflexia bacterium]|uniref:Uncharacterized protein n=1 Tax=uncultured Chloroflexia bacterium TaxID=1672391 RepID=A0A6J4ICM7_9CHLR|nr:MAG: hypothetical protein AVDCRST_MAG26-1734 [uncultured Chloroflexia bacterium]
MYPAFFLSGSSEQETTIGGTSGKRHARKVIVQPSAFSYQLRAVNVTLRRRMSGLADG